MCVNYATYRRFLRERTSAFDMVEELSEAWAAEAALQYLSTSPLNGNTGAYLGEFILYQGVLSIASEKALLETGHDIPRNYYHERLFHHLTKRKTGIGRFYDDLIWLCVEAHRDNITMDQEWFTASVEKLAARYAESQAVQFAMEAS